MKMEEFYRQFIGPDDLVFDIGAHLGERTEVFSHLGRKVIALEPIAETYAILREKFKEWPEQVVAINKAAGPSIGRAPIATSSVSPTIGTASMSPLWADAVYRTKRFGHVNHWDDIRTAEVTTLDDLIEEYGTAAFIKIDVEGYERQVLEGLSKPVKALSFEFTPERLGQAFECVYLCHDSGLPEFNLSLMETFELGNWNDAMGILDRLSKYDSDTVIYGDVYARRAQ